MNANSAAPDTATLTAAGLWRGMRDLAPLSLYVFPFGIAYGAAAIERALTPAEALTMSALVFAGASQLAALEAWREPLPYAAIALTVLAINARHILLGAAIAPWMLRLKFWPRALVLGLLSDANWAHAMKSYEDGERDAGVLLGGGAMLWLIWIVTTAVGVYAGRALGDLTRFGFDLMLVTFFAATLASQWRGRIDILPWLTAGLVALAGAEVLPLGWHVIAGGLAGGFVALLRFRDEEAAPA